jgi:rhamnose transport system ATP-binding protein
VNNQPSNPGSICQEYHDSCALVQKIVDNLSETANVAALKPPFGKPSLSAASFPFSEPVERAADPLVSLRGVAMQFGGTRAVDDVDLDLNRGEVLGLIGENGAGKSTLMRVVAGFFEDYEGEIAIDGRDVDLVSPARARREGIALVHQELSLLPEMTVAENIFLGREPGGRFPGSVSFRRMNRAAREALASCGVDLPPATKVADLSIAERQLVEIVKAVALAPRVLILDEPTSSLTVREVRELFAVIRRLKERGASVVYVSHKLDEVRAIADRIVVMRDGRRVAGGPVGEWTEPRLVRAMVGRDLTSLYPHTPAAPGDVRLEARDLTREGAFGPVTFTLRAGEIVGLYGIVGAGRSELAEALFGLAPADRGEILVDGRTKSIRSAAAALRAGIALVPEDRRRMGLALMLPVSDNMSLSALPLLSRLGFVDRGAEQAEVARLLKRLLVRTRAPSQEVSALSGGNQQKVVLGRALMPGPRILILDEPTRGVDVVAKAEVHGAIDSLAREGLCVLLISSELPEIIGMSDRVLVMRDGRLVGEAPRQQATEELLVGLAAGARHV